MSLKVRSDNFSPTHKPTPPRPAMSPIWHTRSSRALHRTGARRAYDRHCQRYRRAAGARAGAHPAQCGVADGLRRALGGRPLSCHPERLRCGRLAYSEGAHAAEDGRRHHSMVGTGIVVDDADWKHECSRGRHHRIAGAAESGRRSRSQNCKLGRRFPST